MSKALDRSVKDRSPQTEKPHRKTSPASRAQIGRDKRARTRKAILSAAFDVFGRENGLFTRIDAICEQAQISRRTFYNHFDSLENLFSAAAIELTHEFFIDVLKVNSEYNDVAAKLAVSLRLYLERVRNDQKWGWGLINTCSTGPLFGAETYSQVKRDIEEGMASGRFVLPSADVGRDIVTGTILAAIISLLRSIQHSSYPSLVVQQILIGLGVENNEAKHLATLELPEIQY